jgi:hypothetical protein
MSKQTQLLEKTYWKNTGNNIMQNTQNTKLDYILDYPDFALGIINIGEFYAKVFIAVKTITNKTTKETKELLDSPSPIIIKKGTKRSLIADSILLDKLGATNVIIFIDQDGEMHWNK